MTFKLRLPGGMLKVKQHHELRRRAQKCEVPVWQVGKYFLIWGRTRFPTDRPNVRKQSKKT
ncbi:hypothetical protein ACVDG5_002575 [Mesorhizobium sp. ORM6]